MHGAGSILTKDWIPASAGMTSCAPKGLFQQPAKEQRGLMFDEEDNF
jgi:hypothetical protein